MGRIRVSGQSNPSNEQGTVGLQGTYVKHIYGEVNCNCGFTNKTTPKKIANEPGWTVELGE